jgi:hypothetical protein
MSVAQEDLTERRGRIVTFYSYKGGTGRSMAVANAAWILASQGERVLVIDWDLEAPGLHRYFAPFVLDRELTASPGIIDFLCAFVEGACANGEGSAQEDARWFHRYTDLEPFTFSLDWEFEKPGGIDFVPAGQQGPMYAAKVVGFEWQRFYEKLGGGVFLEAVKTRLRASYDWILIDSRTGISDTAGICTVQLPDDLVLCFTLNHQSIAGAAAVAESAFTQRCKPSGEPGLRVWPVPTRVELAEKERLEAARDAAQDAFEQYLMRLPRQARRDYWGRVEVPYDPYFAYEEVLATFADRRRSKLSVLGSMEAIVAHFTEGLSRKPIVELGPMRDSLRIATLAKFTRQPRTRAEAPRGDGRVYLNYSMVDRELAEKVVHVLNETLGGAVVWDHTLLRPGVRWQEVLSDAVRSASVVIVLLTRARLEFGMRHAEMEFVEAIKEKKTIIPLLYELTFGEVIQRGSPYSDLVEFHGFQMDGWNEKALFSVAADLRPLIAAVDSKDVTNPDDPQKGRWGGVSEHEGRRLAATVEPVSDDWFKVTLQARGTPDRALAGEVEFHLHPTFRPAIHTVEVRDGRAILILKAWGAFTVGAKLDGGRTLLELDLAALPEAPEVFRTR